MRPDELGHAELPVERAATQVAARLRIGSDEPRAIPVWAHPESVGLWLDHLLAAAAEAEPGQLTAAEWLLDNDYLVRRAAIRIREDLPKPFYRRLPTIAGDERLPRALHLAHGFLDATHLQLSASLLIRFLGEFQRREPLLIAELWAFPTMLRVALVERLAAACHALFPGLPPLGLSDALPTGEGLEPSQTIARSLTGLRALSAIRWEDVFDPVCLVEQMLSEDPAGVYPRMDFDSRDQYRRAVEDLARRSGRAERDVARRAVEMARARSGPEGHVGTWLVGPGRLAFAAELGVRPAVSDRLAEPRDRLLRGLWFGAIGLATLGALLPPLLLLATAGASAGWMAAGILLFLLPASVLAVTLVNWAVTHLVSPRVLPRLDLSDGLPDDCRTLVAKPVLAGAPADAETLARRLESHFLANPDESLDFVLLSDLPDAPAATMPGDEAIVAALVREIERLNALHPRAGRPRFHLLHRERQWNDVEGCWMGWERKRGKLEQLNRLLLTGDLSPFPVRAGLPETLVGTRYVVTADADTRVPQGAVAQLVGTLAHPLNRFRKDGDGRRWGYTVLQPRVEVAPEADARSRYARLMSGDTAIDIYSRAVSDVYQDLFGEGVFAGKGIYDVAAFAASLEGRVPENRILSHDLFEGLHGRAGLVTDIQVYEGYPSGHLEQAARQHRWVRGDWQLIPWLWPRVPGPGGQRLPNPFDSLGRWKLFDNLRRSLVAPSLVLLVVAGWLGLPGGPWLWTLLAALVLGAHIFTDLLAGLVQLRRDRTARALLARTRDNLARWALGLAFLLDDALVNLDAIARTLWRMLRRERLLQWTASAQVAARLARSNPREAAWRRMWPASALGVALGVMVLLFQPAALAAALPLILLWVAAPEIAAFTSRPLVRRDRPLSAGDLGFLRRIARRTWLYFETFAGPADNWLPPDNVQEDPHTVIARRTSPTNIGMMFLAALTAWRLGHLGRAEMLERLGNAMDSLERLPRHRGHVLNWVETANLTPLEPRYVSAVDSGNLAASLMIFAQAMEEAADGPDAPDAAFEGLADLVDLVDETLAGDALGPHLAGPAAPHLAAIRQAVAAARANPECGGDTLAALFSTLLPALEDSLAEAVAATPSVAAAGLRELQLWLERSRHHVAQILRDREIAADPAARARQSELARGLAARARTLAMGMDFAMLFDARTRLLHIGYDVSTGRMDPNCYDLLATEARIASYFAIAKGDLPVRHWFRLGREVARTRGRLVLVSWNGSMFEYLMPEILMPAPAETLVGESALAAVDVQIAWGERLGIPWGVSESGYAEQDPEGNYRYRAFGVPGLGLRRGLERDRVVAPYAAMLALLVRPGAALANLRRLAGLAMVGRYGFHEAIDFTPERLPARGDFRIVRSWMAHHQGMGLAAIGNLLLDGLHARWFLSDPGMASADLLLSERVPWDATPETMRDGDAGARPLARPDVPGLYPWAPAEPEDNRTAHLVANAQLTALFTTGGGGSLSREGQLLLRGLGSASGEAGGRFLLLHEPETGETWDMACPNGFDCAGGETMRAVLHPHMLELHRRAHGLIATTHEGAGADEPILVRRVTLVNETGRQRRVVVASVAEVVLGRAAEHDRHPAFSRMFVESRWLPALDALLFRRRPRHSGQSAPLVLHRLVSEDPRVRLIGFETDRRRLLGRHGRVDAPLRLVSGGEGAGATGFTLDPALALMAEVSLPPHSRAEFYFVSVTATNEDDARAIAQRHLTPDALEWELGAALGGMAHEAHRRGLRPEHLPLAQRLLSEMLKPSLPALARPDPLPGQPDLWALGISGDDPILLVRSAEGQLTAMLPMLLAAHRWWRERGIMTDLVLLHGGEGGYVEPVRDRLMAVLRDSGAQELLGRRSGVHVIADGGPGSRQVPVLEAAARIILDADGPPLADQLAGLRRPRTASPPFAATGSLGAVPEPPRPAPALSEAHAHGGFGADGRHYVIDFRAGVPPPAPRANVIANPGFGTIVTEAGLGWSWAINSGENRLTPWTNDPVSDPQSEVLYLRDEVTAAVWTPTPLPCGDRDHTIVEHGAGHTRFLHLSHGLRQELSLFVASDAPVKFVRLRVDNPGTQTRRLTATYFAEWLLGSVRGLSDPFLTAWYAPALQAVLARNGRNPDFAAATAFLGATLPPHSVTTSREAFLGPGGNPARPEGLARWDLGQQLESRGDACAALQVHLDVPAGGQSEVVFLLGQGASETEAEALLARFREDGAIDRERARVAAGWEALTGAVTVETPDPRLDRMVNHWLVVQAVSSRIAARAGFYQAGGAIGFRDQLQDVMNLLFADPGRARAHIIDAARHQFEAGDVLHWWHPPGGQGVRTRCSDDLLWLPFVTAAYVEATGDAAILDEPAPFLCAEPLAEGEHDRYARFPSTARAAPLFEHLERAMERGHALGADGLPLIGTGDWNDGMDRIGAAGRGQSLWLGWFLVSTIEGFARLCRRMGRDGLALRWEARRRALVQAIERVGWDGQWYLRAIDDEGVPWGSAVNEECRIDLISQAWAVLSGAADPDRARQAMDSACSQLVRPDDHIVRLLDPPFHATPRDPGYIRAYPPGIRENGGQYSHAAAWAGLAFARLGDGARAKQIFDRLNPACHAATAEGEARYMTEPYVMAADIGGSPPHVGRGGWTWYTGAAGWTWRLAVEGILGLSLAEGRLVVSPCLPPDWPGYRAIIRQKGGSLALRVTAAGDGRGAVRIRVDGADWEGPIPFPEAGRTRTVDVTVGVVQETVPAD